MANAQLSRRVEKVVGYPPLSELGELQRREFHEALLEAGSFDDLPGKWQAAIVEAEQNRPNPTRGFERLVRLLPQPHGFEGLRTIQIDLNGRQATVPNSPDMGRFPLGRYTARTTLGEDADKHRHSTAGVDEAFRFKPKFCPRLAKHADQTERSPLCPEAPDRPRGSRQASESPTARRSGRGTGDQGPPAHRRGQSLGGRAPPRRGDGQAPRSPATSPAQYPAPRCGVTVAPITTPRATAPRR